TNTLEVIAAAKGAVLAVEAEKTILLDPDRVVDLAVRNRIHVVAIREEDIAAVG
ncbi:MAG: UDP-2,3-diacylglucosamine diphosphatase LpxI, partial [Clostridia bacterium]|nr:UDP-2,3-diacylglucosamine diphosphatase LpxI [Clostridia bacterium]